MKKHIYFVLIILNILIPYVVTIFFIRTISVLILLPINLIALILLIISTVKYLKLEETIRKKVIIRIGAIGMVFLYFFSYGFLLETADLVFFKLREKRLNEFVVNINNYKKIHSMTDGLRYSKSVNGYFIKFNLDKTIDDDNEYFIDEILRKEQIDKEKYEKFRQVLIDVDLIDFTILEDGTISFTIDGFLDNCQGFAYSKTGTNPGGNDCGRIIHWKKVSKNWYAWYTT